MNFKDYSYLVNNYGDYPLAITNIRTYNKSDYGRAAFEEWNEKTFLEYCGIEVKDEVNELEKLRKENAELKHKLKEIEDQPKVGDVCLFWDEGAICFTTAKVVNLNKDRQYKYASSNGGVFENCIKATNENIQAKINELKND